MKAISKEAISQMDKIEKLNLINSSTGYKPTYFIATKSIEGNINIALFNNLTVLSHSPSLIGFIIHPSDAAPDSYQNIMETGYFTINHITADMITDTHTTLFVDDSDERDTLEDYKTFLEIEYKEEVNFPFVKRSPVQLYCKFVNEYIIKENKIIHIIASIEHIFFDQTLEHKEGWIQLDKGNMVSTNGIDSYFLSQLINRIPSEKLIHQPPLDKTE